MMKRNWSWGIFAAVVISSIASYSLPVCADEKESVDISFDEGYKIGLSVTTMEYPFYISMVEGFTDLCEDIGVDYIYSDGGSDASKQVADCEDMLVQGVDAMIISTWYPDAMVTAIQDLTDAGIPVILLDASEPPEVDYLTNVGSDNYESGYLAGLWAGTYFMDESGEKELNYVELVQASNEGRSRADGFNAGLIDSGAKVDLLNSLDASTREVSMSNAEDSLVGFSDIDLIFGACAQGRDQKARGRAARPCRAA